MSDDDRHSIKVETKWDIGTGEIFQNVSATGPHQDTIGRMTRQAYQMYGDIVQLTFFTRDYPWTNVLSFHCNQEKTYEKVTFLCNSICVPCLAYATSSGGRL